MDATLGCDPLAPTPALPGAVCSQQSAPGPRVGRWWLQSALIGTVFVLGLLQGSRAALGRMPLAPTLAASTLAEAPAEDGLETDTVRGHFYRPNGSDAVRPALRLRQNRWLPAEARRIARACPDASC